MRRVAGWHVSMVALLLAGGGGVIALSSGRAALGATTGKVILQGARPFTESWTQMVRQDAAARRASHLRPKPDSAPPEGEGPEERDEEGALKPLAGLLRSAQDS